MSNRFYVGTRKGLFAVDRTPRGWIISDVYFPGENVSMFLQDPRDGALYALLNLGHFGNKLRRSTDRGSTWEECCVPTFGSDQIVPDGFPEADTTPKTKLATLKEVWALETGGPDEEGVLWAGTIPAGLFRSSDRGDSWQLVQSLWDKPERMKWFGGGKDEAGVHTVCVDPRDSNHVTIAISCGGVWDTRDDGATWNLLGQGLRQEYTPPDLAYDPTTQDAHRLAFCQSAPDTMWVQHHNGIFHSTDAAANFREIEGVEPSVFGFAVAAHPAKEGTAWFVPAIKDECRIPKDGQLVVTRTRNGGQTFEQLRTGLPQKHCYDIVFRHALDVDQTGRGLVLGSSTGGLWVSEDEGDSWKAISNTLPQIYCVRFERH